MKKILGISLILVIIDQLTKLIIINFMNIGESIKLISNFFSLTYVKNIGAAWSILEGKQFILIIISLIFLIFIYLYLRKKIKIKNIETISYSLIISGVIGNLIDRIIHNGVIDYLDFKIINYDFPIFNIADICIVIGSIILIYIMWKDDKNDFNSR